MILTILCHILLLERGGNVFALSPTSSPTRSRSPLSLTSSPLPLVRDVNLQQASPPLSSTNLAFSPRSGSSSNRSSINITSNRSSVTPINSNNGQVKKPFTSSTSLSSSRNSRSRPSTSTFPRRRRDPIAADNPQPQPQQSPDWLIPPFNPSTRPDRGRGRSRGGVVTASSYNTKSSTGGGLAYRSILPIRTNTNHYNDYTGLYRNRNLFSGRGSGSENNDDYSNNYNNFNYNYNANGNDPDYGGKVSPQDKNDIGSSSSVNLEDSSGNVVNPSFTTLASTSITTADFKIKSAPATEAGSVSSTLEMGPDFGGPIVQAVVSRDAIGSGGSPRINSESASQSPISKMRQAKIHKVGTEEEDSIVFPGSVYRPPSKRPVSVVRPGKAASNPTTDDDDYVPPPLKSLDKAAFESFKMLLETRRISQALNSRNFSPKNENVNVNPSPALPAASPLDIKGRPKCATQNNGYCDEIDTYPKEFFNQVLKNSLTITGDVFQEVFGDSIDNKTVASDLAGRDGLNLMLDSPLCSSIEHTIYPKVAENKDGKFMYIVNHDEYIQGVRVEKCVKESAPCMYLEGSLTGYQSACRQKYIYRKLLAFTRDGKATTDTFRLPACCVCHVRSVFVDDRINTAGFGSESDYIPSPPSPVMVMPKATGENSTTSIQEVYFANATAIEVVDDDRLSDEVPTATELSHGESGVDMHFPTILPDAEGESSLSSMRNESGGVEVITDNPAFGFRAF